MELDSFFLFSAGGRFHYDGFGFGTLMFGNIAIQTAGYYLIALLCLPLGYGHIKSREWSRKITLALLWDWLILGLPLSVVILLMLVTSKGIPPASLPIVGLLFVLFYPVLPILAVRFCRSDRFRRIFHQQRPANNWVRQTPEAVLALGSLMILGILALYVPILFNGVFPLFGRFQYGLDGILMLDLSIVLLAGLTWGVFRRNRVAWWGTALYISTMIASSVMTFLRVDLYQILTEIKFASLEMDALQGVPVRGVHLGSGSRSGSRPGQSFPPPYSRAASWV